LFQCLVETFAQLVVDLRGPVSFRVGDLLVHGEHAGEHFLRLQRGQHRLERVIHSQQMRRAASTGQRQHYLVRQGALRQQVLSGESRTRSRLISTCCASRRPRT
jgi:hypothetical protein